MKSNYFTRLAGAFGRSDFIPAIVSAIFEFPILSFNGLGLESDSARLEGQSVEDFLAQDRLKLFEYEEEFWACFLFVGLCNKTKSYSKHTGSYSLTGDVGRWAYVYHPEKIPYVPNGILIAAAHHCGFRQIPRSEKSLVSKINIGKVPWVHRRLYSRRLDIRNKEGCPSWVRSGVW